MAKKSDNASMFKIVAGLIALCLVIAAGLVYLQAGGGSSGATELAALSQAIPSQAQRALDGDADAFAALDKAVKKVASLRRGGAPGRSADWQQLESRAAAILAGRESVEVVRTGAGQVNEAAAAIVTAADALFDRSGATAIIQEFQQRADRLREAAALLPAGGDNAVRAMSGDAAFLRAVVNGLAGEPSELDLRPLNAEGREAVLVPIQGNLATIEEQLASLAADIASVTALAGTESELRASADQLLSSAFVGSGSTAKPSAVPTAKV